MAALLTIRRGGDVVAQCDASCYNARHETCVCSVCDGANHGIGREQATVNARAMHAEWVECHRAAGQPIDDYELDASVQHEPLFPLP